jgi:hypothetical protein
MGLSTRVAATLGAIALAASITSIARADDALKEGRAADLFKQGRTLMEQGKTEEACAAFRASKELVQKAVTLINLAQCDEKLGKTASALGEFTKGLSLAKDEKNEERVDIAREGISRLEPKVVRVTFTIPAEDAEATLLLDGDDLPLAVAKSPTPIDPGQHSIVAKAPGRVDWNGGFTVGPTDKVLTVPVPVLELVKGPDPIKPPDKDKPPQRTRKKKPTGGVSGWAVLGFTVGGASLLTGIITGAASLGMSEKLKENCTNNTCGPDNEGDLSTALGLANASNVLLPVGVVGLVLGGVAIVVDKPSEEEATTEEPTVSFRVGPGFTGIRGTF